MEFFYETECRVRDRSEKPTDRCSDNEIGRGLATNSPALGTRPKIIENKGQTLENRIKNSESKQLRILVT
jgi:hypothetical protein